MIENYAESAIYLKINIHKDILPVLLVFRDHLGVLKVLGIPKIITELING